MEKKDGKNYGVLKFFETLILITLIGSALMIVLETFFDQINEDYEEDEEYYTEDYSYDYEDDYYYDYDYDYNYDYSYDDYDSDLDYSNTENTTNTTNSTFTSIEDFMNSETGKEFLEKSNQNLVNSNKAEVQNVVENEVVNEVVDTTDDFTSDTENSYNYYDAQNAMKDKFEAQKKKIEIKDEGKSLNDEIMVSIKNNDEDFLYDITLNTIFSKGDKIVSIDVQDIKVIDGNNTKYVKVLDIPEDYDNYEFLISKKYYIEYYNELLNDDISYHSEDHGGYVEISIQNNSSKRVNRIHFTILYFDSKGNLIDFEEVQDYSIKSKKTSELMGYGVWDDKNREYLDFSDYEVILDYAENYKY